MRDLGVRSLFVTCELRHYEAVLSVERRSDAVLVRAFPVALVCTRCGIVGADTRRPLLVTEARVGGLELLKPRRAPPGRNAPRLRGNYRRAT
jgi:hypothetical protein